MRRFLLAQSHGVSSSEEVPSPQKVLRWSSISEPVEESEVDFLHRRGSSAAESEESDMGFLRRRRSSNGGGSFLRRRRMTSGALVQRNSILDTKTLYARGDVRTASFCSVDAFRFDAHFEWQARLGSGSFAEVWAVRHKARPTERYAIKCLKQELRTKAERASYLQEVQVANALPVHPHVLRYYRAWQDEGRLYLQMELCGAPKHRARTAARPPSRPRPASSLL